MKKRSLKLLSMALALVMLLGMLTGCGGNNGGDKDNSSNGGNSDNGGDGGAAYDALNIMFVVTGSLGGGTNNDDVYSALSDYTTAYGGNVDTVECNMDTSLYESSLVQSAEMGEYDLIVTGFGTMVEPLQNTAAKFPDQKFFIFDTAVDFTAGDFKNVMSVQVLQNEGGFLVGALAALMTTSDAPLANEQKTVGFVGAIESTAILDFLMGYIEGVNYVDSSIEVLYSFVGNHNDAPLTKEIATTQHNSGADVVFAVSSSDLAAADAALENDFYAICVDADEATNIAGTSRETAEHIMTSVVKDYYNMVYPILEQVGSGTANWGTHSYVPYADGGVIVADNEFFRAIVPESVMTEYQKIADDMAAGKITVSTAFGASTEEIDAVKALAAPF